MNDLNTHIDMSRKFTAPVDAIPVVDRSPHVGLGVEMAQRAAAQSQMPVEPPKAMPAIMPVAN